MISPWNWVRLSQQDLHVASTLVRHGYYVDTLKTKSRRIFTSFPRTFSMQFRWSKNPRCFHVLCLYPPALQQELLQVSFLGIYRTTKVPNNFWRLHCYGVTLVKKCNKQQLQISETNNFDQTRYIKDLFKVNEKNNSGVLGINQIMSTLLTLIKRFQLNC